MIELAESGDFFPLRQPIHQEGVELIDVLIPAAVGGVLGHGAEVNAPLVVGPANNQLT
ncbi:hypothetical protein [Amycolatopsis sp. NPDC051071]|uniref:hypothetical protein n=1 Tax=Amycolatopsis sp. NPDC051071 TaxID=3154637 RepID=UPI00341E1E41